MPFLDRVDAGRQLAAALAPFRAHRPVILGLPRGGVPVAAEVARALDAALDVIVVRKIGAPGQPELAVGALGEEATLVLNDRVVSALGLSAEQIEEGRRRAAVEVDARLHRLRAGRRAVPLDGRVVIIVDDGIATGATARAACHVVRSRGPSRVILASPVAPPAAVASLRRDPAIDEVVVVESVEGFGSIGEQYLDFRQVSDAEVSSCLMSAGSARSGPVEAEIAVPVDGGEILGLLAIPDSCAGLVVFAHGSGSGRMSARNRLVAGVLQAAGLATLLVDLRSLPEQRRGDSSFDLPVLAGRLSASAQVGRAMIGQAHVPVGYAGSSTGAAVALWSAAEPGSGIAAIVSRGGRPDLASSRLPGVLAPTLLIVGGRDEIVREISVRAQSRIRGRCVVEVVPGATHLFEEPGALVTAAELSRDWMLRYLVSSASAASDGDSG